ncbi:hypothetical protein AVEN_232892-1, partial [Araneus ventricosus]
RVGFGVVIDDATCSQSFSAVFSVYNAKAMAILYALQRISRSDSPKFCIYSDSMSALQQLSHVEFTSHPIVLDIVDILRRLESRGFEIVFCWIPSHVVISSK